MLNYTEIIQEGAHPFDATAQPVTITLLSSAVAPNKEFTAQKIDNSPNAITLQTDPAATPRDTFVGGSYSIIIPGGAAWFSTIRRGIPGVPIRVLAGAGSVGGGVATPTIGTIIVDPQVTVVTAPGTVTS